MNSQPNPQPIETALDPDLRFSHRALQRAALRAQDVAHATGTLIVVSRNGVIEHLEPVPRLAIQPTSLRP